MTVSEQDAYPLLGIDPANSATYLNKVLGTVAPALQSGFLRAQNLPPGLPAAGVYPIAVPPAGSSNVDVAAYVGGGKAFTLVTRDAVANTDTATLTIANVDANAKTFSMQVSWSQTFTSVKTSSIDATLGGSSVVTAVKPATGLQPGFVLVQAFASAMPKAGTYPIGPTAAAAAGSTVDVLTPTGAKAFTLVTRDAVAAADTASVTVSKVDPTANTFSLDVQWSQTFVAVTLGKVDTTLGTSTVVSTSKPATGAYLVPSAGVFPLSGGVDNKAGAPATSSIPAGQ